MVMNKIYGYCRISRPTQKIERQIANIQKQYPDALIIAEAYTGTKIHGRKEFERLCDIIEAGDTIVFDSVSRMSRNAEEGYEQYIRWYDAGINLIFLKEPYINTDTYRQSVTQQVPLTGSDVDDILIGINKYLKRLAKQQIRIAFEQAQKEVDDLHQRTSEGMREAKKQGKQIGQVKGRKLVTKKSIEMKQQIKKKSRDFYGVYPDNDLIKILGISRNTFYKYKKELAEELNKQNK